jgi:site-specific DNA recombinase
VLRGLSDKLLDPDLVEAYVAEWQAARAERLAGSRKDRARLERRIAEAEARVGRFVAALGDGRLALDDVASAVTAAKAEKARAEAELREIAAEKVVALHPGLAGQYRKRIADLLAGLDGEDATATREALRALIERITITPKTAGTGTAIAVEGVLSTIVDLAGGKLPDCTVPLVPLEGVGRNRTLLRIAV